MLRVNGIRLYGTEHVLANFEFGTSEESHYKKIKKYLLRSSYLVNMNLIAFEIRLDVNV